jgi:hypothetical protein
MIRGNNRHCVIKVEFDELVNVGFFVRVNSLFIEWHVSNRYKTESWKESEHPTGWGGLSPRVPSASQVRLPAGVLIVTLTCMTFAPL